MTTMGPLEFLAMGFPGEALPAGVGTALERIQDRGEVHVVEALLITKNDAGAVRSEEITDVVGIADDVRTFSPEGAENGLIDAEGVADIAAAMDCDSTALALLIEHHFARDVVAAFRGLGGTVLASTRLPETPAPEPVRAARVWDGPPPDRAAREESERGTA